MNPSKAFCDIEMDIRAHFAGNVDSLDTALAVTAYRIGVPACSPDGCTPARLPRRRFQPHLEVAQLAWC